MIIINEPFWGPLREGTLRAAPLAPPPLRATRPSYLPVIQVLPDINVNLNPVKSVQARAEAALLPLGLAVLRAIVDRLS